MPNQVYRQANQHMPLKNLNSGAVDLTGQSQQVGGPKSRNPKVGAVGHMRNGNSLGGVPAGRSPSVGQSLGHTLGQPNQFNPFVGAPGLANTVGSRLGNQKSLSISKKAGS